MDTSEQLHSSRGQINSRCTVWTGHADFNSPFETIAFLRSITHLETDVMLESKAKDLSLLRLRVDIVRYAPDLAGRYGITATAASDDAGEVTSTELEVG